MKKSVILVIFFTFITNLMAFSISSLDFNKTIKVGGLGKEQYFIKNDNTTAMRYLIKVEGSTNVKVSPSSFILKPYEKKAFIVEAKGQKVGEENYLLIIMESSVKKEKGLNIRMNYEIEQRYKVIK